MHIAALVTFSIFSAAYGQSPFIDTGADVQYKITLEIFSGRPNPEWVIDRNSPMYSRIAYEAQKASQSPCPSQLGYRGFYIESSNAFGQRNLKTIAVGSDPELENLLYDSCPTALPPDLREYFDECIQGKQNYPRTDVSQQSGRRHRVRRGTAQYCRPPRYEPWHWNTLRHQLTNNCYNYASNRRTNTFAQPGRARTGRGLQEVTSEAVMKAVLLDGFTPLPGFDPRWSRGGVCYIALVIWPDRDYHFYRMDDNNMWSHKAGRTAATNLDSDDQRISDPRTASRGRYTDFVGYIGNNAHAMVR